MGNNILFFLSVFVFGIYNIIISIKYGFLPSISDSYYKHNNKILFALFIWFTCIPLMIISSTPLMFLSGAILCFVGASPDFEKDEHSLEDEVHSTTAIIGTLLGFASMIFEYDYVYNSILIMSVAILLYLFKVKNKTLFMEYISFIYFMIVLYIEKVY